MSKPKILISQIKNVTDIKRWNLKGIESCKKKIFGYAQGLPGEKNWIKPLVGKSMQNYYFPSKYLHMDFNMKEYLRLQTVRFQKKEIDDSLINLQKCINLIIENKDKIDNFLSNISKEMLIENQSLKDFYFLYSTIFPSNKFKHTLTRDDINDLKLENENFSWFDNIDYYNDSIKIQLENINNLDNNANFCSVEDINISNESKDKDNKKTDLSNHENKNEINIDVNKEMWMNKRIYKNIIFTKTKGNLKFKKIILRDQHEKKKTDNENECEEKIYYLDYDVNIGLENKKEKSKKEIEEQEQSKNHLHNLLNENESLRKTFSIRNRFIDPLYLRRRYSFIDKLTKKKIKKEKYKTYRKHFIQHADEKKIWPDNKGLLNKVYPNPFS
ncbi:conserved Plasmodium protein, unknown function [Plasmodium berghei]|uniref:Uncharacterized protein n=2 Tax=Plasmodium berghei TaxID=5821 RepID=A0A509ASW9_PLABA|nr:conserved protein, unknown function [Plasmodium berghei ANKA]CXJ27361.1 conserved Plasmodium protein, unknown function [Plasmodium berghei]SCM26992.1 conserved Plasmodium protein, unknown function [Plasmodium berghei]SCN28740.1 conserved Plasmodium protein, unknown function [Plasmodium berghei]SCO63000.1 conserved Plasmodium protein, unknown function [Plasmodium berghei]SCO64487.1 conserved Plasmodium protein, unknown function [Plasmodium berghei]|eukprot:XP_034424386.1 conserved protein, unknown function [Plasmodium berghei ANKA]